jgi:hypothetical protein
MKKPGIPTVVTGDRSLNATLIALKENVEIITGARPQLAKVQRLQSTATLDDVINKLNEVISRINYDGN